MQVGTRISGGPYHQGIGVVTRYEPGGDGCYIIGRGMQRVTGYVDIVWPNGESRHVPAQIVSSLPYHIHDGIAAPEEIAAIRAQFAAYKAQEAAKRDEAAKARAELRERLIREHPELVRVSDACNSLVAAGKNIRKQLAAAFPGVKFAVRSSRFSGGDSISVRWTDGPTSAQVKSIVDRYRAGDFDGMTDSYEYRHDPWTDLFGDAKYVSTERDWSDATVAMILERVAADLGGLDRVPTIEDFRKWRLWTIKQSGGCDFEREFNRALSDYTQFPA